VEQELIDIYLFLSSFFGALFGVLVGLFFTKEKDKRSSKKDTGGLDLKSNLNQKFNQVTGKNKEVAEGIKEEMEEAYSWLFGTGERGD